MTIQKLEDFLGLDKIITENHFVRGERGYYCINQGNSMAPRCLAKSKGRTHVEVSESVKSRLRKLYAPYNRKFYENARVRWNFNWPEA